MEERGSSRKKSTLGKKLFWVGSALFILSVSVAFLCGIADSLINIQGAFPCRFTHKVSFVPSMTDQESKVLTVHLYGEGVDCMVNVRLDITNFDMSPSENIQQASITAYRTTQVVWVLSPKSQGKYSYVVSFPGSQTLGIDESVVSVTNEVGLPAWVTSVLVPVAVAVLGPLLTAPFWLDKCTEWIKERQKKRKAPSSRRKAKKR